MQSVTRNSYSLYKRKTGSRTIYYVRFWHDDTQSYSSGRSTGQETRAAANRQVQKWLTEGLPEVKRKDLKATKNRLMGAITKYLEDCEVIKNGDIHEEGEIIKLFYTQVTNMKMSSGERFVTSIGFGIGTEIMSKDALNVVNLSEGNMSMIAFPGLNCILSPISKKLCFAMLPPMPLKSL
jgi:hypothetical protein